MFLARQRGDPHPRRLLDTLKHEIRELNPLDKVELLKVLVAELEPNADAGVAQAWLEEARRRHAELSAGTVSAIPASVVFERARERLSRRLSNFTRKQRTNSTKHSPTTMQWLRISA